MEFRLRCMATLCPYSKSVRAAAGTAEILCQSSTEAIPTWVTRMQGPSNAGLQTARESLHHLQYLVAQRHQTSAALEVWQLHGLQMLLLCQAGAVPVSALHLLHSLWTAAAHPRPLPPAAFRSGVSELVHFAGHVACRAGGRFRDARWSMHVHHTRRCSRDRINGNNSLLRGQLGSSKLNEELCSVVATTNVATTESCRMLPG